ncbi:ACT domain-containing protein [Carboxydothermus pertinax]|uniref:Amino acid-binding protein n=1 Tax=Carboxydothermus pertinax TaxID=870242 RepID=A0A1L8CSY5_9THEO|nr:ACT domain-containing protein [Carboxydothermus pertinax]GAV21964.1 amino acid-binding protein [Carboxydothermus pertinax]
MIVKQLSVFLENKSGRLARVTEILGENKINIRALSIADTTDFGILRLIVNKPDEAYRLLKAEQFMVSLTDVIAVEVPDNPGGLAGVLKTLEPHNINIEYLYAFVEKASDNALVVFRVEEIEKAIKILTDNGIKVFKGSKVYSL